MCKSENCAKRCICNITFTNVMVGFCMVMITVVIKHDATIGQMMAYVPHLESFIDETTTVGAVLLVVNLFGCVGIKLGQKYILMVYFVLLSILTITKLITAFVYLAKASKDVSPDLITMLQGQFDESRLTYTGLEYLLGCCGVTGIDSYTKIGATPSVSCCEIKNIISILPGQCTEKLAHASCESKVWPYLRIGYNMAAACYLFMVFMQSVVLCMAAQVILVLHRGTSNAPVASTPPADKTSGATGTTSQTAQGGTPNAPTAGQGQGPSTAGTPNAPPAGQGPSTAGTTSAPTAAQGQSSTTTGKPNTPAAGQGQSSTTIGKTNTPTAGQGQSSSTAGTQNTPAAGQGQSSTTNGKPNTPKTGQGPGK